MIAHRPSRNKSGHQYYISFHFIQMKRVKRERSAFVSETVHFYLPSADHLSDAYVHSSFVPKSYLFFYNNMEMCFCSILFHLCHKRSLFLPILPIFSASVCLAFFLHSSLSCSFACEIVRIGHKRITDVIFRCCILFSSCSTFSWYVGTSAACMPQQQPTERVSMVCDDEPQTVYVSTERRAMRRDM